MRYKEIILLWTTLCFLAFNLCWRFAEEGAQYFGLRFFGIWFLGFILWGWFELSWYIEENRPEVRVRRTRRGTRGQGRRIPRIPVGETNIHHRAVNLTVGIRRTEDVVRDLTRRLLLDIKEEGYIIYALPMAVDNLAVPIVVPPAGRPGGVTDLDAGRVVRDALFQAWNAPEQVQFEDDMALTYVDRLAQDYVARGGIPGSMRMQRWAFFYWLNERMGWGHSPIQA